MDTSPIFLIGTHRSGTTWLGGLLGGSRDVAYWSEPRQVWSYGNWSLPDDRLEAHHATERIQQHIRRRFERYTAARQRLRFCEKTPSNCLRIPFMQTIFPQGKFILLLRDGRAVFRSTDEIQQAGADWDRIWARIRESHWREWPAYWDRLRWIWKKLRGQRLEFWGVRPPGWQAWLDRLTPAQIIAQQWSDSITTALADFERLPAPQKIVLRYEDLVAQPQATMAQLVDFLQLSDGPQIVTQALATVQTGNSQRWVDELGAATLTEIRPIIEPTLTHLGYQW
jgi:hypothetical protein